MMRMQDAVIKLLIRQPFYGSLASVLSLRENAGVSKTEMSLLPTPVLTYNRDWFEQLLECSGDDFVEQFHRFFRC